jgi:hypothetical protein
MTPISHDMVPYRIALTSLLQTCAPKLAPRARHPPSPHNRRIAVIAAHPLLRTRRTAHARWHVR